MLFWPSHAKGTKPLVIYYSLLIRKPTMKSNWYEHYDHVLPHKVLCYSSNRIIALYICLPRRLMWIILNNSIGLDLSILSKSYLKFIHLCIQPTELISKFKRGDYYPLPRHMSPQIYKTMSLLINVWGWMRSGCNVSKILSMWCYV